MSHEIWLRRYVEVFGPPPEAMLYFDLETTGLDVRSPETLPTQVGWLLSHPDGSETAGQSILNWEGMPGIPEGWYYGAVDRTAEGMRKRGFEPQVTSDRVRREGLPADEVLVEFFQSVVDVLERGIPLAGHNIYSYDRLILERLAAPVMGGQRLIDPNLVFDLGPLSIAMQRGHELPQLDVPRSAWYDDVLRFKGRVKWSLGHVCSLLLPPELEFGEAMHDALGDCRRVRAAVDSIRQLTQPAEA